MSEDQSMIVADADGLNVRKTPGLQGELINTLPVNTTIKVILNKQQKIGSNTWVQIAEASSAEDVGGWCALELLRPDNAGVPIAIENPNGSIPQGFYDFQTQAAKLGLPEAFNILPVDSNSRVGNAFGPNSFAYAKWQKYYSQTAGMHSGTDYVVPFGTPILALSDGVIVGTSAEQWKFILDKTCEDKKDPIPDIGIILWPFHPEKDVEGHSQMSNVLVAYAHLSDNTLVKRHDVVKAGQVIGKSGYPVCEPDNNHLHLEVHLLSSNSQSPGVPQGSPLKDYHRPQPFRASTPLNPILFFTEDLVKVHLGMRSGMGPDIPQYPTPQQLGSDYDWSPLNFFSVASYGYGSSIIWNLKQQSSWAVNGIFDPPSEINRISGFTQFVPYPMDFLNQL